MAEPVAATVGQLTPRHQQMKGFEFEEIPDGVVEVEDIRAGMFTAVPRSELPKGAVREAKNARIDDLGIRRRNGSSEYGTKPDSNPVRLLMTVLNQAGDPKLVRVTDSGIKVDAGGANWVSYTDPLSGVSSAFDGAMYLDDLYLASPTYKVIQIDFNTATATEITDSPNADHITNFADRIVVGNIGSESYKIQWSANADPTDWTGTSSGEENLVQAPSHLGDAIQGLFGFADVMVVLRRQSIWHVSRRPFADAPFRFDVAVTGLGCDLPGSAVQFPGGVIFADRQTNAVYLYQLGSFPKIISKPIRDELFEDLQNLNRVQATYIPEKREYHLGLATDPNSQYITKTWVFSLRQGGWTYDDGPEVTTFGAVAIHSPVFIDDLVGTIDSLEGVIDNLGGARQLVRSLVKGTETGEVIQYLPEDDTDYDTTAFEFDLQSYSFGSVSRRRTMKELVATVDCERAGDVIIEHSNDRSSWSNSKTTTLVADAQDKIGVRRPITGDDLFWRIRATGSDVRVLRYWMRMLEKGMQRGS